MINFPMTVDPSTADFDYTAESLGITPVEESKTTLKIRTYSSHSVSLPDGLAYPNEMETLMTESNMGGDFDTIWIGKDASMNFIKGSSSFTLRHEIQSLAFEDGRTNLFEGLQFGYIDCVDYDPEDRGHFFSYSLNPNEEDYYRYVDDLSSPIYASSNQVPEEYDSYGQWGNAEFVISKELKLPEGITSFPVFNFGHTASDPSFVIDENDPYYCKDIIRHRHDIDIYIPSTITSFTIYGYGSDPNGASNSLFFGYDIGLPLLFSLLKEDYRLPDVGFPDGIPYAPDRGDYESDEEYEADFAQYVESANAILDLCDHVHIYLKNHTSVPTINFQPGIYFPIVFHVNEDLYDSFVAAYENNPVTYKEDYSQSEASLPGISPLSFVKIETYEGTKEVEVQTSLSETKFSGVAITGSYNDLADKPEIPDFTELLDTIASLQSRVSELEDQMIVENGASDGANDFSEVEPENSSDSVVTDYE